MSCIYSEQAAENFYEELCEEGEKAGLSDDAIESWIEQIWEARWFDESERLQDAWGVQVGAL